MRPLLAVLLVALSIPTLAADPDSAALELADRTETERARTRDWRAFLEATTLHTDRRDDDSTERAHRLSVDVHVDTIWTSGWRAVLADRLDGTWTQGESGHDDVNTLKEAYLSWQPAPERIFDAGRVNVRHGVATGYNPTDFFRDGAVRSAVSADPASLRENRLGTALLRGQWLWDNGSIMMLYSPRIADSPDTHTYNPDWGATNNRDRWLLAGSVRLGEDFDPQWLVYGEEHESPQFGLNLTALLNNATVVYLEWSGGRAQTLFARATAQTGDDAFRHRTATGLSYTMPSKLSVTFEYQHNSAALDAAAWKELAENAPALYWQYRGAIRSWQEMPTRSALFVHAKWQDALFPHFDLTGMARINAEDRSRFAWTELRYHWSRADLAVQHQRHDGNGISEYGALPDRRTWSALVQVFL
jgi:hypothetical protein